MHAAVAPAHQSKAQLLMPFNPPQHMCAARCVLGHHHVHWRQAAAGARPGQPGGARGTLEAGGEPARAAALPPSLLRTLASGFHFQRSRAPELQSSIHNKLLFLEKWQPQNHTRVCSLLATPGARPPCGAEGHAGLWRAAQGHRDPVQDQACGEQGKLDWLCAAGSAAPQSQVPVTGCTVGWMPARNSPWILSAGAPDLRLLLSNALQK